MSNKKHIFSTRNHRVDRGQHYREGIQYLVRRWERLAYHTDDLMGEMDVNVQCMAHRVIRPYWYPSVHGQLHWGRSRYCRDLTSPSTYIPACITKKEWHGHWDDLVDRQHTVQYQTFADNSHWQDRMISKLSSGEVDAIPADFWRALRDALEAHCSNGVPVFAMQDICGHEAIRALTGRAFEMINIRNIRHMKPGSVFESLHAALSTMPHVSTRDPAKLAYTPTEQDGQRDRRVATKPGRWLTKFFGHLLPGGVIADLANLYTDKTGGLAQWEMRITTCPDEIERVYTTGPSSCMSYYAEDFRTNGVHPSRVYGNGINIAVAYFTLPTDDRITARTVVNTKTKEYVICYGNAARLEDRLHAEGYCQSSEALEGCYVRMLKIDGDRRRRYVMPYIDGEARYCEPTTIEGKQYFALGYSGNCADNTNGTIGGARRIAHCYDCEENIYEGDEYEHDARGEPICASCLEDHYVRCERSDEYVHYDDIVMVHVLSRRRNGTIRSHTEDWCTSAADDEAVCCEACHDIFDVDSGEDRDDDHGWLCLSCRDEVQEEEETLEQESTV